MRKHILAGAASVFGLSVAMLVPMAAQTPAGGSAGDAAPGVSAPAQEPRGPARGPGMRRGGGPGGPGREGAGPRMGRGPGGGRLAGALNLSDDQRKAIEALRVESRDELAPIVDRLRVARADLHRAIFADKPDGAVTKKLAADVASLEDQIAAKRLETGKSLAALLTEEQRARMRTGVGMADGGGAGRRGPRHGPGPAAGMGPAALRVH